MSMALGVLAIAVSVTSILLAMRTERTLDRVDEMERTREVRDKEQV